MPRSGIRLRKRQSRVRWLFGMWRAVVSTDDFVCRTSRWYEATNRPCGSGQDNRKQSKGEPTLSGKQRDADQLRFLFNLTNHPPPITTIIHLSNLTFTTVPFAIHHSPLATYHHVLSTFHHLPNTTYRLPFTTFHSPLVIYQIRNMYKAPTCLPLNSTDSGNRSTRENLMMIDGRLFYLVVFFKSVKIGCVLEEHWFCTDTQEGLGTRSANMDVATTLKQMDGNVEYVGDSTWDTSLRNTKRKSNMRVYGVLLLRGTSAMDDHHISRRLEESSDSWARH